MLLVNPNRMKPAVVPLGLDYLATSLKSHGHQVDLVDLCFASDIQAELDAYFSAGEPEAIGVSIRNTDDCYYLSRDFFLPAYREVVRLLRERSSAPIILGGVGYSLLPGEILAYLGADFGVVGEGEEALPRLLSALEGEKDFAAIPNLIYRDGPVLRQTPRSWMDLGGFPRQGRRLVDNLRYFRDGGMGAIEAKRGCSARCLYCADPVAKGRRVRLRSPESVAEELEALLSRGIDHLHFCDSEFNIPQAHAVAIGEEMLRRRLGGKLRWYVYASPQPFDRELAAQMSRAGCAGICFGADSGSEAMLRMLGRDFTPEDLRQTACLCHREGIPFMYDLLLGGPGETQETAAQTIALMKEIGPSRVGMSLGVRVYPGTGLAQMVREQGALSSNPHLKGELEDNESFLKPIFYLSPGLGEDPEAFLQELVAGDERFFLGSRDAVDQNYNYNDNSVLVEAIRGGYRGAFWDILRRLAEGGPPSRLAETGREAG